MLHHLPIARPEELDPGVYEIGRKFIKVAGGQVQDVAGYAMFDNAGKDVYIVLRPNNADNEFTLPLPAPTEIKSGGSQVYQYNSAYSFKQIDQSFSTPAAFKAWVQANKFPTLGSSQKIVETYSTF